MKNHIIAMMIGLLAAPIVQAAKPLWTFTPLTATSITVTTNNTAIIQYLVTNQSNKMHRLTMIPIEGITQMTTMGSCASPFNLASQASCVLSLQVNGSTLNHNVDSGPKVCQEGSGLQCYQPTQENSLHIQKSAIVKSLFAYITNGFASGANNVTRCAVLNDGSFTDCATTGTGLNNPTGIVMNAMGNLAYITNLDTQDVSKCAFDTATGNLTGCTNSAAMFNSPAGIVLNASNTYAYIANAGADNISQCQIAGNGDLLNCAVSGTGLSFPIGVTINAAETYIYIANFSTNNVTKCALASDGSLINCIASGTGLQTPTGIAINPAGNFIYVVNAATTNVSKCQFDGNGDLTNCVNAGGTTLSEPRFITFSADGTRVYIANALSNNVTQCTIDGAGDLTNCVTTGTNMNGATGIQLLLL